MISTHYIVHREPQEKLAANGNKATNYSIRKFTLHNIFLHIYVGFALGTCKQYATNLHFGYQHVVTLEEKHLH